MLSAIIITKNEEQMIADCLVSLAFADEILVVDTGNTDKTNAIAKDHRAKIVTCTGSDYSQFRNVGLKAARGDWILYVDADERVTPQLRQEILGLMADPSSAPVYQLPRRNIFLGRVMHYGGWGGDRIIRLFKRSALKEYRGALHEQPEFSGELGTATGELVHFSHRDLSSMVVKTLEFTDYEARLRLAARHPPVVWWRFLRVMATEFWLRFGKLSAWRDGPQGVIDGLFQVFNSFVIYARLWELQHAKTHPAD